jgi:transposase
MFAKIFNLFGLKDVVASLDESGLKNCLNICARLADERQACPRCKQVNTTFKQKKERQFLLPPINSTKVLLSITVKKCRCKSCKKLWWPIMPFSEGKQRFTQAFKTYAISLLRYATVKDIADHLGVNWNVIKNIHKRDLEEAYNHIDMTQIEYLSVDEIAIRKGHTYMTIFSDSCIGRIVHAVRGKKKKDIASFLKGLKKKPLILRQLPWICANPTSLQSRSSFQT